jgi:type II secretory pathway component PulK
MRSRGGFAQLVVLWGLLLLGTLSMSFSFAMRTEALAARNGLDSARAYYQARTGVNRALAVLSAPAPDNVLAEPLAGKEEDVTYETRIVSEGGKVDINFVAEGTLKEILVKGGLSPEEAESVGDSILDWRDEDDTPRAGGAESAYYAALRPSVGPRNGKLASVDELLSVQGVTPELYRRLLSKVFTVHGVSPAVDVNSAPVEVLRVLPGFTPRAADALVTLRREKLFRSTADVASFLAGEGVPATAVANLSTARVSRVYTISSVGRAGGKIARGIACRVEIGGRGEKSVKILRWVDYVAGIGEEA